MKNQRGGVKLITLIGVVLILTVILFSLVVYKKITKNNEENEENEENVMGSDSINQIITSENTLEENELNENNINQENSATSGEAKIDDFSMKFLQLENNKKNMIYSPLSIKYALKMLQEGASGNTYTQINNVIGNLNLTTYKNIEKKLSFANGIYIRDSYSQEINKDFINNLKTKYNAEVKYDKFENATNINKWIEEKTLGIIKNMLEDETVQEKEAKMLLINALAIDMKWELSFDFNDTCGNKFYLENGQEMIATTMNKETSSESVSYYLGDNVTALSMNLEKCDDVQLEFLAIMPNSNLQEYIQTLTTEEINNIDKNLNSAKKAENGIEIQIPKFKFNYDLNLAQDLQSMGITDAFSKTTANFLKMQDTSKITTDERLYVKEALHKADIDFSEKGVKAAAVTVFSALKETSIEPIKPEKITIDKPFMFIIRDKNTKEKWFTGTVYEPNAWENDKTNYEGKGEY